MTTSDAVRGSLLGARPAFGESTELESLYRTAPVGLCLLDRELRFLRINDWLAGIDGRPADEHLGRTPREMIPAMVDGLETICRRVIATGRPVLDLEVAGTPPAGPDVQRYWLISGHPLGSADGRVEAIGAVVRDITGLKRTEAELRVASEELERRILERTAELQRARETLAHVGRVSMMEGLAGGLAHELNQPLAAIVNYAEAALETTRTGGGTPAELGDDLEQIVEQSERAAAIVRRMRSFVRKEEPIRAPCDINDILDEIVPLIRIEADRRGVEIRVEKGGALPLVSADWVQMQQVILNLVRNGMEAVAGNGGDHVCVRTVARPGVVEVAVSDTGPGLSVAAERAFEPFYTTRDDGLGLGLSIVRSIVEAHHGQVRVQVSDGPGVTFCCMLPAQATGDA